jgi:hypothetical protein
LIATLRCSPLLLVQRDAAGRNQVQKYGEYLFNEIARDIISADIAVFDTSGLTPNVMLEMGVALTSGTRVPPILTEPALRRPARWTRA